jgi:type II secretory pathway predicted ATPase ExeA
MYTDYWKLNARPFEHRHDPRFYYPSEAHQATLLKLRYAIENQPGAALLAGASGLGKTLLMRSLSKLLPETFGPYLHVKFPQMSPRELLAYVADKIDGQRADDLGVDNSIQRIEAGLAKNEEAGHHTILIIDEAHLLAAGEAWETIRLLLNLESGWTMLLVGQPQLLPLLERFPQLDERLSVKCLLRRFNADETAGYVQHRLQAAGGTSTIFDPAALETIHELSEGIPRRINRLCDLALLIGFADEQPTIRAEHLDAVAAELFSGSAQQRRVA